MNESDLRYLAKRMFEWNKESHVTSLINLREVGNNPSIESYMHMCNTKDRIWLPFPIMKDFAHYPENVPVIPKEGIIVPFAIRDNGEYANFNYDNLYSYMFLLSHSPILLNVRNKENIVVEYGMLRGEDSNKILMLFTFNVFAFSLDELDAQHHTRIYVSREFTTGALSHIYKRMLKDIGSLIYSKRVMIVEVHSIEDVFCDTLQLPSFSTISEQEEFLKTLPGMFAKAISEEEKGNPFEQLERLVVKRPEVTGEGNREVEALPENVRSFIEQVNRVNWTG